MDGGKEPEKRLLPMNNCWMLGSVVSCATSPVRELLVRYRSSSLVRVVGKLPKKALFSRCLKTVQRGR